MRQNRSTRRELLGTGVALGTTLLTGCLGGRESPTDDGNAATTETTSNADDGTYTVAMEPMGAVEFDGPPERWTALLPTFADMAFALGGGQTLGIQNHERFATEAFEELPGIDYNADEVVELVSDGVSQELFYEMDADLHFIDPHILRLWYGWNQTDVDEVAENIGPFFGNFIRRHSDTWHEHEYYTLYEAFELMAEVFRARDRYRAFVELHEQMLASIDENLPPADQRPSSLLVYPAEGPGFQFYPFRLDDGGVSTKQWRDLGLTDALESSDVGHYSHSSQGTLDIEALIEIDPEALLVRNYGGASESTFENEVVEPLRDSESANEVQAVRDGAIYNAGYLDQGPIINFYHTERAAKDIFPDAFDDVTLFDRQRIAAIVKGDL